MRRSLIGTLTLGLVIATFLIAARTRAVKPPEPKPLSATRSFEITDKAIVESFTLDRVLTQLIARSGVTGLTSQQLLRQMFDTQNPQPGLTDPAGPHCNDVLIGGVPSFNGFPRRCPTPEGVLAATPYLADDYFTMGIMNRFDQAPADGSNCGQYRLVFAHRETDPLTRLHLIFEAVLPNPDPAAGLAGCRPVAQFWADLSNFDSMNDRRARIETFFFKGLDGFAPVIDPANFDLAGGIRTLEQTENLARFYQFRLVKNCGSAPCTLRLMPDVLENTPYGLLFDARIDTEQGRAFRDEFVRQVPNLAIRDVNLFAMQIPKQYLMVESNPTDSSSSFSYDVPFGDAAKTTLGAAFRNRIQAQLDAIGNKLTPEQIITRALADNCFGCHGFSGLTLGDGVKFVSGFGGFPMISETILMDGEGGPATRYGVDPIITTQFIPHRMQILQDFLRDGTPPGPAK